MLHFRPNELDISIWYWILPHNYLDMIIKLKEGKEGENKINPVTARRDSGSKFFICCKTEYVLSGTYQRGPSQRAMSPDCSWHPLLQGYVVVNSGLKKGSMCELRCYEGVLKNRDYFTQNMKVRDSPFTTNMFLTFSRRNLKWSSTALQLLLKKFQHVAKCSKSSLLFYGNRHKTNHTVMRCLLHFSST